MRQTNVALAILAGAFLAACGGSDNDPEPVIVTPPVRGALVANPPVVVPVPQADGTTVKTLEPAVFTKMLEAQQPGSTQVTGTPKCAITTHYMKYVTVGGKGENTDASGAIMVPSGTDPACSGPRPVLLYTHGTALDKNYNLANLGANAEAQLVAAVFASQGFIVVAPNYAGYDSSSLKYHPYLNAEQQANDSIDALRAARTSFSTVSANASDKLFITGYSQGGYVALATQRAMQLSYASEFKVTAVAGQSGPYAMLMFTDATLVNPNVGGTQFFPLLTSSWQNSYGNMYSNPNEVYEAKYLNGIETLLPSTLSTNELFATGKLPQAALFAKDAVPGPSSPAFAAFFGEGNLVKSSFRTAALADAQANPCNNGQDPLNCTPTTGLRINAKRNDLRTYVPNVPVMLCGGNGDPTVFYANTHATAQYFLGRSMAPGLLTVLDVDSSINANDPYAAIKVGFGQQKAGVYNRALAANSDPALALAVNYHAVLVPPFCQAAARGYFQAALGR